MIKNSIEILNDFLNKNHFKINLEEYLSKLDKFVNKKNVVLDDKKIIEKIILDSYKGNSELVKKISNEIIKTFDLFIGRVHKTQLKKYLDYNYDEDFDLLFNLIKEEKGNLHKNEFKNLIIKYFNEINYDKSLNEFKNNLNRSIEKNDKKRIGDYIIFLYSRIVSFNERKNLSLKTLYLENKINIQKDFSHEFNKEISEYCKNNIKLTKREIVVNKFNKKFIELLEKNTGIKEKYSTIYLNINYGLFSNFENKDEFYNYLYNVLKEIHSKLENHKTLVIKIENIIHNSINIKWEIYSYLTIFAENFISELENRPYYVPKDICSDILSHKFNIKLNDLEIKNLELFYKNKLSYEKISTNLKLLDKNVKKTINSFKKINTGFSFIDCNILKYNSNFPNSHEINFITNNNEISLVFFKHSIDERKIPCPVCSSLTISGNSYSEIGTKSWECKNKICSERSKTNRGKRYSEKAIFMQSSNYDFSKENLINKEIIKVWRKDLIEDFKIENFYEMMIKYYSYPESKLLFLNQNENSIIENMAKKHKRTIISKDIFNFLPLSDINNNLLKEFNNNIFFDFIFHKNKKVLNNKNYENIFENDGVMKILKGNCFEILNKFSENSINNMVTSPPYYNAREYSNWPNLYCYLNDMYNIILESNKVLEEGGVFFYNIGDIFDNPNIIIKSKMGDRRIPLGAYLILIFQKAGFYLLENIIWYKGETQSNRHKNDGNFTPYYQKPANCYEHMFIFKKKGKLKLNKNFKENILDNNIIKFTPVFKIFKGGVNNYGHTAPYPKLIPSLSINCFTSTNDSVLDPFLGSGTSSIVAIENKRNGIGIELNDEYAKLCVKKAKNDNIKSKIFN